MSWQQWVLVVLFAGSTAIKMTDIGKPREALTPRLAAWVVAVNAIVIWLVVTA